MVHIIDHCCMVVIDAHVAGQSDFDGKEFMKLVSWYKPLNILHFKGHFTQMLQSMVIFQVMIYEHSFAKVYLS